MPLLKHFMRKNFEMIDSDENAKYTDNTIVLNAKVKTSESC